MLKVRLPPHSDRIADISVGPNRAISGRCVVAAERTFCKKLLADEYSNPLRLARSCGKRDLGDPKILRPKIENKDPP